MLSDTISSVESLQYLSIEDINENQTGGNTSSIITPPPTNSKFFTLYQKYKSKYLDVKNLNDKMMIDQIFQKHD